MENKSQRDILPGHSLTEENEKLIDSLLKSIGNKLKEGRERKNYSMDAVAIGTHHSIGTISRIENGRCPFNIVIIAQMAECLGLQLLDVITPSGNIT